MRYQGSASTRRDLTGNHNHRLRLVTRSGSWVFDLALMITWLKPFAIENWLLQCTAPSVVGNQGRVQTELRRPVGALIQVRQFAVVAQRACQPVGQRICIAARTDEGAGW